jgi:hypothetical protein
MVKKMNLWVAAISVAALCSAVAFVAFAAETSAKADSARQLTFSKDVAPIFQAKCDTCHHPNTSAPMSLMTYNDVRPWAKAIKARVVTRDMPPWHIDKTSGIREFSNDISLDDDQIATVAKWVDQGAIQGNASDMPPLPNYPSDVSTNGQMLWVMGTPDTTTTTNDFKMYAKGSDWWINQFSDLTLTEDRYIQAMEVRPSNRKIVHHCVISITEASNPEDDRGTQLIEYAIGKYGDTFAPDTGRLLKKGTYRIIYDMHYNAGGTEQINHTTLAIKFYPKGFVPKYKVRSMSIRNLPNDELEVPPNTVVRTDGYYRLPGNVRIDAFQPHLHSRGKGLTLETINLDNTVTLVSSVDHFNFNWHVNYVYSDGYQPLVPAGTILHIIGIHDNTAANPRNPDPNVWAGYGERSVDDMLQLWMDVVDMDDTMFKEAVTERYSKAAVTGREPWVMPLTFARAGGSQANPATPARRAQ